MTHIPIFRNYGQMGEVPIGHVDLEIEELRSKDIVLAPYIVKKGSDRYEITAFAILRRDEVDTAVREFF